MDFSNNRCHNSASIKLFLERKSPLWMLPQSPSILQSLFFRSPGNRNRQGDPPVLAERLLCISREIWEKILDVVERVGPGGSEEILEVPDLEELIEEKEYELETVDGCLQISQTRLPWWERENWQDVWDEAKGWGELSQSAQRELTRMIGEVNKRDGHMRA